MCYIHESMILNDNNVIQMTCTSNHFMSYQSFLKTETQRSSVLLPWSSQETLKTSFNFSSEYQGCRLCVSVKFITNFIQRCVMHFFSIFGCCSAFGYAPPNKSANLKYPIRFHGTWELTLLSVQRCFMFVIVGCLQDPFYKHGSTLIPVWISNHMPSKG